MREATWLGLHLFVSSPKSTIRANQNCHFGFPSVNDIIHAVSCSRLGLRALPIEDHAQGSYLMWPSEKSRLFSSHEYSISSSPGFMRVKTRVFFHGLVYALGSSMVIS
jgi:hypothetical protein